MWHVLQFATTRIITVSQGIWLPHFAAPHAIYPTVCCTPTAKYPESFPTVEILHLQQTQTGWLLIDCELLGSCHMKFESDILLLRISLKSCVNKELQSPGMYVQGHSTGLGMFTQAHGWCSVPMLARFSYPLLPVVRGHLYQLKYC